MDALFIAAGYLAGSLPFGYWLVRGFKRADIRTVGELRTELDLGERPERHTELRAWLAQG